MLDRRAEATAVAERALAIGTQAFGPDDVRLTGPLAALGELARDQENYKDAESYFESFQEMSKVAQDSAISSFPLILGKTDKISTIHRPTYTDFIVVKILSFVKVSLRDLRQIAPSDNHDPKKRKNTCVIK